MHTSEGFNKGAGQKAIEIATRMLEEKVAIKLISSVTGLDINEILKIQNKM